MQTIYKVVVLLTELFSFLVFAWGVKGHFRSEEGMPAGMRAISIVSLLAFLHLVWCIEADPLSAIWAAGPLLSVCSLALFLWAVRTTGPKRLTLAFTSDRPAFLVQEGPYKYIRHPFYAAYIFFWIGTAFINSNGPSWYAALLMLGLYVSAAKREEAKFAHSSLATSYAEYRRCAGMFLPRIANIANV